MAELAVVDDADVDKVFVWACVASAELVDFVDAEHSVDRLAEVEFVEMHEVGVDHCVEDASAVTKVARVVSVVANVVSATVRVR